MLLIAVAGVAGSGKSLLAERLREHYGAAVVSIADPLKRAVLQLGATRYQLYGPSSERETVLPGTTLQCRRVLEVVGDALLAEDRTLLIGLALRRAAESRARIVVIPDARYHVTVPELPLIREAGGKLIKRVGRETPTNTHRSNVEHLELPDTYFDAVLPWYADKGELYARVDELVREWS